MIGYFTALPREASSFFVSCDHSYFWLAAFLPKKKRKITAQWFPHRDSSGNENSREIEVETPDLLISTHFDWFYQESSAGSYFSQDVKFDQAVIENSLLKIKPWRFSNLSLNSYACLARRNNYSLAAINEQFWSGIFNPDYEIFHTENKKHFSVPFVHREENCTQHVEDCLDFEDDDDDDDEGTCACLCNCDLSEVYFKYLEDYIQDEKERAHIPYCVENNDFTKVSFWTSCESVIFIGKPDYYHLRQGQMPVVVGAARSLDSQNYIVDFGNGNILSLPKNEFEPLLYRRGN